MRNAQRVLGITLGDWFNNLVSLATLTLAWSLLSLTMILLPPATVGLYGVTREAALGRGAALPVFLDYARRHLWRSYRWALLNIIVIGLGTLSLLFYGSFENVLAVAAQFFVGLLLALWIAVQFYAWPFVLEQDQPRLIAALRNSLFLTLGAPLFTLTLLLALALSLLLSAVTLLPLIAFWASFAALLGHHAMRERLIALGKIDDPTGRYDPNRPR